MRLAMMALVKIREGGETIGGNFLGFAAAVHLGVDRQRAAAHVDDFALEGDDVACEDGELEVDAVKHEQDGVLGVNILGDREIGALQEILRTTTCKKGLVMVQISKLDQSL